MNGDANESVVETTVSLIETNHRADALRQRMMENSSVDATTASWSDLRLGRIRNSTPRLRIADTGSPMHSTISREPIPQASPRLPLRWSARAASSFIGLPITSA